MGIWKQGDYSIYVELAQMKAFLNNTCQEYENNILRCSEKDSNLVSYYRPTAKRYRDAAHLLEECNTDFDLRTLILYHGLEDKNQNIGHSEVIRSYIKQLVKTGTAIVFYKGEQIFALKCISEYTDQGGILQSGYEIRTYFDDVENCIFREFMHMGW